MEPEIEELIRKILEVFHKDRALLIGFKASGIHNSDITVENLRDLAGNHLLGAITRTRKAVMESKILHDAVTEILAVGLTMSGDCHQPGQIYKILERLVEGVRERAPNNARDEILLCESICTCPEKIGTSNRCHAVFLCPSQRKTSPVA